MDKKNYKLMHSLQDNHWWFVARKKIIQSILSVYLKPDRNKNILEIGCGSGGLLKLLSKYGNLSAIELDDFSREKASEKKVCKVIKGKLPNNISNKTCYETIFLFDVLEHIEEDKNSIKKINELLSEHGLFILTVPAYMFLWSYHDKTSHHKRRYSMSELTILLDSCGFNIKYSSYFNMILLPLIVIVRLLNKLLGNQDDDLKKEKKIINHILKFLFSLESMFLPKFSFPFGVSIFIICQKKQ